MKVAKKLQDENKKAYFAVSNKDEMSYELSEFGLDTSGEKPLVAARDASDQKYVMKEEFRWEHNVVNLSCKTWSSASITLSLKWDIDIPNMI